MWLTHENRNTRNKTETPVRENPALVLGVKIKGATSYFD